jgi:hypothetical protein
MPWSVTVLPDHPILVISYSGALTSADFTEAFHASGQKAMEHRVVRFLADCTELGGGYSVFDLFFLVDMIEATGVPPDFREALLLPTTPGQIGNAKFYEDACMNRGILVKLFTDRDEALAWLMS